MAKTCDKCGAAAGKRCKNCKQRLCPWHMQLKHCPAPLGKTRMHVEDFNAVEDER